MEVPPHSIGVGKLNLGKLGYPIGALLAAFNPPQHRLRVEIDGKVVIDVDQPVLMVAVGNGASVGGGTELTPEADPESGMMDVMICAAISPKAKLGYAAPPPPAASTTSATTCSTSAAARSPCSGEEFWVSADGEIYGPER